MKYLFILPIIVLSLSSCTNNRINEDLPQTDSVQHSLSLLKSLNAIGLDSLSRFKYSIDFEKVDNKKILLDNFRIVDIMDGAIKIRPIGRLNNYLFVISADTIKDIDGLANHKYDLLFSIDGVKKLDYKLDTSLNDKEESTNDDPSISIDLSNDRTQFIVYGSLDSLITLK
jgi:hypothetical protein